MSLLLATRNRHKAKEIEAILGRPCLTLLEFDSSPTLVEDGDTFAANASAKASQLARWLAQLPGPLPSPLSQVSFILADDSGLEVDTLDGAPGVHSARFASPLGEVGGNASDAANNAKLLLMLEGVAEWARSAHFRCVLALIRWAGRQGEPVRLFEGSCEGHIALAPSGEGGFGYDPLFIPHGYDVSFAALEASVKNRLSHRAQALERLRLWLNDPK